MNYNKIYESLVERARNRTLTGYVEMHHILPKCIGGDDTRENLVYLTPEEHYLAHQLLVKIHPDNKALVKAAAMMIPNRPSNKMYGWLKRRFSEAQSEDQTGDKNSQFGTKWIFNENEKLCKKIPKECCVPPGWKLGRVIDFDAHFERLAIDHEKRLKRERLTQEQRIKKIKTKHHMFRKSVEYRRAKSRKLYKQFRESGLSLRKFAIQNNMTPMTLSNWFNEFIDDYNIEPRKNANKQLSD